MGIELAVRQYRRRFVRPLHTAHGLWIWREGLLVRLRDSLGRVGYGEIAPIPWFGSEALEEALSFCKVQGGEWQTATVPAGLPATQFGLGCALAELNGERGFSGDEPAIAYICGLLPTGAAAMELVSQRLAQGHRTLKWKIGVQAIADEIYLLQRLIEKLPQHIQLRLDANGGLLIDQAEEWLAVCDRINSDPQTAAIEHLEQPLSPDQVPAMIELDRRYQTAIALDESVATVDQLEGCWNQGWRGVVVVKPAIAGSPQRLQAFCQSHQPQMVFSSAFETVVGRRAALAVASRCSSAQAPALGFGTQGWFADDWDTLTPAELWDRL
ncbi:o-succinylbenzoate synthase [filamentous cyanobacterium CCT1]|nr:o-succinylbenzoate synthase [filamentous cyanobacterium CCT1]PSN80478.1 o-succinylbenzoate synthase [filamentous cyanobacterium CCP4]